MQEQAVDMFLGAKWIWAEDNTLKGDYVIFRRKFSCVKPPKSAVARIAAENTYSMFINGKNVIVDGGLPRESSPGNGYYDEIDIAKFLVKGDNVIGFSVLYKGTSGKNNIDCGAAGLLFECAELNLISDKEFKVFRNAAYYKTAENNPSGLYSALNEGYDATRESQLFGVFTSEFESNIFNDCFEFGSYGCEPFGTLELRPIPLYDFTAVIKVKKQEKNSVLNTDNYIVNLGGAKRFKVFLEVFANGTEKIEVKSDRYSCQGAWGDESNFYSNERIEYIAKNGAQEYESIVVLSGTSFTLSMPNTVKLLSVGYREVEYASNGVTKLICSDKRLDEFAVKAEDTIKMCMTSAFIDTPDRERSMWLGDFSLSAASAIASLDSSCIPLIKKTLTDILRFSTSGILCSNVMGCCPVEIPSQGLIFISSYGALTSYYNVTGDKTMLEDFYPLIVKYLMMWEMDDVGLITARSGNKRWYDYLYNADSEVLENALYYAALKNAKHIGDIISNSEYDEVLDRRIVCIEAVFGKAYYKESGYCSKEGFFDERANAWAVLAGLASEERFEDIKKILANITTASPYMESFILEAQCKMGDYKGALKRFYARYTNMIESENPTLCENFNGVGTLCQSYTAAPIAVLWRHFVGVKTEGGKVTISPNVIAIPELKFSVPAAKGIISGLYRVNGNKVEIVIDNDCEGEVYANLSKSLLTKTAAREIVKLNRGRNKFILE